MEKPTPTDERQNKQGKLGHELIFKILQGGVNERNQIISTLNGNAKSSLAAGTVVLGIVSTGMGIILTALSGDDTTLRIVELQRSWAVLPVITGFIGSVLIFVSIVCSVRALQVMNIRSPFSSKMLLEDGKISESKIDAWEHVEEASVYRKMYEEYALAMQDSEKIIKNMGTSIAKSQTCLVLGLTLSFVSVPVTAIMLIVS